MSGDTHYDYKCEDHSILLRVLHRPVFMPVVRALPLRLTPNQVTVFGNVLIWLAVAVTLATRPAGPAVLAVLAAAYALYVLTDCVDGLFARHTQRTSRLGELLDHGLDSLSLPLVVLSFTFAMNQPAWLVLAGTAAVSFINFVTLTHGFRVGYVHLGTVGIIEGILGGAAACTVAAVIGVEPLARPLFAGVSVAGLLVLGLVGGSLTALVSMRSVARRPSDFALITLMFSFIIAWYVFGDLSPATAAGLFTAVSSYQAVRITCARLCREPLVLWDGTFVALALIATGVSLAAGLDKNLQLAAAVLVMTYAGVRSGLIFSRTVKSLQAPRAS